MTITAHDSRDPACGCSTCIENRWREDQEELHAQRLLEENQARNRERQLRLPMSPLPHCAGQPTNIDRAFRPFQLEL